jgi:hypothetical protein
MTRGVIAAVLAWAALLLAGCGSAEPPEDVDLFREYLHSSDVVHDPLPGAGMSPEDRIATFAAYGPRESVLGALLGATECADECDASKATRAAADDVGGALYERHVLVKHEDGGLEVVPLYVASTSADDGVLIDDGGTTYTGLDDFRDNNDIFTSGDLVLLPENLTRVPGEGKIATVYGRTTTNPLPWVAGGAVLLGAGAGFAFWRRARRPVEPEPATSG